MAADLPSPDAYTLPFQLTSSMHRDVYPAVDPSSPALSPAGKVLFLTGATGGVGFKIAETWSAAGVSGIVLFGRDAARLQAVASELSAPTLIHAGSLTSPTDVQAAFDAAVARFGKVDVLINCAASATMGPLAGDMDPDAWWTDYEVNVRGTYNTTRAFVRATGGTGTVINVVSLGASFTAPGMSAYGPSKLAVIKLGELLDLEYPKLRVFSLHPGIVRAEGGRGAVVDHFTHFARDSQRLSAGVALWLSTPAADFLSGGFLSVNWDVEEMVAHMEEITEKKLVRMGFLNATLGPEGHKWE